MSAASDFMTNAFRVKLTDIVDPSQKRARIRVNINGEEKEYIVTEGSRLYPGSSLTVKEINVIKDSRTSKITYEIIVRVPRDTTRITKSFFEKIAEGAADLLGLVSDDAETAVRDAAGVDQTGSAAASRGRMAAGETAAEIAAENEKCQTCGGSSIDLNTCDKNECMGLGPCYYTESTVGIPGQVPVAGEYGVRTYNDQCYSCAKAESCSNFNDNREMCIAPACTNRAGLNCEWDESENICRAKAAAQEASETPAATSAPAESTATGGEQISCASYGERRGLIGSCRQSCNPNEAEATGEELCTGTNTQCCILSVFDEAKVMSTFNEAARAEGTCASYGERRGLIGSCRQSCNPNEAEATGEELYRNKYAMLHT